MTLASAFIASSQVNGAQCAVECDGIKLSFEELLSASQSLSLRLSNEGGINPGDFVAVCLNRSERLIVTLVAIILSGAAYIPIDPSYPRSRITRMLKQTSPSAIIVESETHTVIDKHDYKVLNIDEPQPVSLSTCELPAVSIVANSLAYLMFTSGSTGDPKCILISHQAVISRVMDIDYVKVETTDRVAQLSNCSFDAFTFEVWASLLNGSTLVIVPGSAAFVPDKLIAKLASERISIAILTTAVVSQVAVSKPSGFNSLKTLFFGGEKINPIHVRSIFLCGGPSELKYMYGPTEATTFASCYNVTELPDGIESIPIGVAISNTTMFILDEEMKSVAPGEVGEIYIGGVGLSHGYLHSSYMTAAKFVPDPYSEHLGARLYKTGDNARLTLNGQAEFINRSDRQVKIRGFRIELHEIESSIMSIIGVNESVVLTSEHEGDTSLLAFLVISKSSSLTVDSIKKHLRDVLPTFMIPNRIILLDSLPLTPNTKVDTAALLRLDFTAPLSTNPLSSNETPTQYKVYIVWKELLKISSFNLDDNFFELGGHSLLAISLVSKLQAVFGVEIPIDIIFESSTLRSLAGYIDSKLNEAAICSTPPVPRYELVFDYFQDDGYHRAMSVVGPATPGDFDHSVKPICGTDPLTPTIKYVEQFVGGIWEKFLSITNIDAHQNYSERFISSNTTFELISRVNILFGLDMNADDLLKSPNLRAFCNKLFIKLSSSSSVVLSQGDDSAPLFLIHPIGGDVTCYRELTTKLRTSRSIVGIQRPEIAQFAAPLFISVADLAMLYIIQIKARQPTGPYYIAGWSFGGIIAYELANLLEQNSESVAYLGLIDTYFSPPGLMQTRTHLLSNSIDTRCDVLKFSGGDFFETMWQENLANSGYLVGRTNIDQELIQFLRSLFVVNWLAFSEYSASKSLINTYWYLATTTRSITHTDKEVAELRDLCRSLNISEIPGDHFSIVTGDDNEMLGKAMSKHLEFMTLNKTSLT
ncbi:non-ribosomal peptide synthetase [Pseudomonas graminis]|uniref:non-ribosomal peptide synthetase n=1 Tax=Pseudomonas graminis TaxID=158627 RepID=UPI002349F912|nr:non-ribosomal peptide synthetase [Pseudomonas graminis]MDC6379895.1 non-ribosomal peptide synthetase [Pseudomonas graminis]